MFRIMAVALSIALFVFVAGCSSSPSTSPAANGTSTSTSTAAAGTLAAPCPAKATKKFAKTRFVADVGLAAGAFRKWIYNPWKAGTFHAGAPGRVTAMVKAGVAGAFVLNRLHAAKTLAQSDPLLCKLTIGPINKLTASIGGLVSKSKDGNLSPADVAGSSGALDQLKSASSGAGAPVKEQTPSIPGLG
jgi:hypothetical protein